MEEKECKKCNILQSVTEYYKHNKGGICSECKSCAKKRVKEREAVLKQSPEWLEKEKARNRAKYHRLNYKEKYEESIKLRNSLRICSQDYFVSFPEGKKACSKCSVIKEFCEFPNQSKSRGGTHAMCKVCTKSSVKGLRRERHRSPEYLEKERIRRRKRARELGYTSKVPNEIAVARANQYKERYPEKKLARSRTTRLKAKVKGNHLHHWSYNEQHLLDVIELSRALHATLHRFVSYDKDVFMYRRKDTNELLDSRGKHFDYIIQIKDQVGK